MQQRRRSGRSRKGVGLDLLVLPMVCVMAVFVWGSCQGGAEPAATTEAQEQQSARTDEQGGANGQVVVTYFCTTARCPTCHRLEEYSRNTVESAFARELEQGRIVFHVINMQEPENQHYIQDYKLYTKSLVVSERKAGKEIRWKNLPDIWKLVRDREKYEQYVRSEIEDYLKDL
jgi:hypothetical protein